MWTYVPNLSSFPFPAQEKKKKSRRTVKSALCAKQRCKPSFVTAVRNRLGTSLSIKQTTRYRSRRLFGNAGCGAIFVFLCLHHATQEGTSQTKLGASEEPGGLRILRAGPTNVVGNHGRVFFFVLALSLSFDRFSYTLARPSFGY